MSKFRILAIDGGGFRGVFSAYVLKRIEEEYDVNWNEHFGLICGTSTGAIIAAGIAYGLSANEIYQFYTQHGMKIFKRLKIPIINTLLNYFRSKYKNNHLSILLNEVFHDAVLGDIEIPLIIPATDIGNGAVHVFKSSYHGEFVRDKNVKISDAVLASCSAPTFFDPLIVDEYLLADGGLWANNPSLVALIDAQKRLGQNINNIQIFSIGTGNTNQYYLHKKARKTSLFGWGLVTKWKGSKLIQMLLNLQSTTAKNMVKLLLDENQFMQINFDSDKELPMDDVKMFNDWCTRADYEFSHRSEEIKTFLNLNKKQ